MLHDLLRLIRHRDGFHDLVEHVDSLDECELRDHGLCGDECQKLNYFAASGLTDNWSPLFVRIYHQTINRLVMHECFDHGIGEIRIELLEILLGIFPELQCKQRIHH